MSNLTLKEQLEALSLEPSSIAPPKNQGVSKKQNPSKSFTKQKPPWLEHAQYGVELLKAYFPECFKEMAEIKPLKIGIKQDLVKRLSTLKEVTLEDKGCMVKSLSYYVSSPAYHKSASEGAMRIDLEGNSAGQVSAEEAKYSMECRKAKQKNDN